MSCSENCSALMRRISKVKNKLKPNLKCKANTSSPEKEKKENNVLAPVEQTNFTFYYDTTSDSSDETSSDEESFFKSVSTRHLFKNEIMDKVKPYIEDTILVWCPEAVLPGDYVTSLLSEFGNVEEILNRWVPQSRFSTEADFGGMVVQYNTRDMAMNAVRSLHLRSKFVQSISLMTILDYMADSEILHPQFGKTKTCLIIKSTVSMKDSRCKHLSDYLHSVGDINDITDERSSENSTICKAWFVFASQAYMAMLLLNGCIYYYTPLQVLVRKTTKEKEILRETKKKISLMVRCQ